MKLERRDDKIPDWLLETLQKPARWDHPTAPSNVRPVETPQATRNDDAKIQKRKEKEKGCDDEETEGGKTLYEQFIG